MDCSTPGFPVHHQLPELAQTYVHWVSNAIQPSYPLSSPSPPAFNLSQHQGLFHWVSSLHQMAKVLELQLHINPSNACSGLISFKLDWFDLLLFKGFSRLFSAPQFESISSLAFNLLYGPTLISVHDYWTNLVLNSKYEVLKQITDRILNRYVT